MLKQKIKLPVIFLFALIVGLVFVFSSWLNIQSTPRAIAATNSTLNFQARLMRSAGSIAADGDYNVEFKLYNALTSSGSSQGSCTGDSACLWTETRTSTNKVRVVNGYLTVNLGSVTAFPTNVNWDQDLYISLNIGGTGTSATWDGEMSPRLKLTAVPYAFRAGQLSTVNGSFTSTVGFVQPTANRSIQVPDESGTLCLQNSTSCGFALSSGSGSYIQNGTSLQSGANFNISGTGTAATSLQAPLLDAASSGALNIGTTNATSINLNKSTAITGGITQSGGAISLTGNAASSITTSTGALTLTAAGTSNWTVGGTNQSLTITTSGTGVLTLGTTGAGTVTVGSSSATVNIGTTNAAHTVNIANGGTSTTQTVSIGSTNGSSSTTIQGGTGSSAINLTSGTNGSINLTATGTGKNVIKSAAGTVVQDTSAGNTSAFQVQNSGGGYVLNVDTSNNVVNLGYLVVGVNGSQATIDSYYTGGLTIGASIAQAVAIGNTSAAVTIQGTSASTFKGTSGSFTTTLGFTTPTANRAINLPNEGGTLCIQNSTNCGFAAASGSANYIQNTTTAQSANMYVQAASSGSVAGVLRANAAGSGDILDLKNGAGTNVATFGSTGAVLLQNSTDSTSAFAINTSTGGSNQNVFRVDTANERVAVGVISDPIGAKLSVATGSTVGFRVYQGGSSDTVQMGNATADFFKITNTGAMSLQNTANSTTALRIQNANATSNVLVADTTNTRVAIGQLAAAYTLDVAGDINTTTQLRIGGTSICDSTGCTAKTGSGFYIHNQTTAQSANMYVQAATSGSVSAVFQANASGNGDIVDLKSGSGANVATFSSTGAVNFQNSTDSTTALKIQNAAGSSILNVDNVNNVTSVNAGVSLSGNVGIWSSSALPVSYDGSSSVTVNGYVYNLGGYDGTNYVTDVYFARASGNGTVGSWRTGQSLPGGRAFASAVAVNGYIYLLGGNNNGTFFNTVYYSKVNPDGSLAGWNTTTVLPGVRAYTAATTANGYIYLVGGRGSGVYQSTVYYAAPSAADGTISSWSTGTALPANRAQEVVVTANNYLYVMGGTPDGTTFTNTIYSASLNTSTGAVGSWTTLGTTLPANNGDATAVVSGGYAYIFGGYNGSTISNNVVYATLNPGGTTGTFQTSTNTLPAPTNFGASTVANGYVYVLGGYNGTAFIGSVSSAPLQGLLSVTGNMSVAGAASFQNASNSTSAFQVQNASGNMLFNVDTTNNVITLNGGSAGALTPWAATSSMSTSGSFGGSVVANGYVYNIGGYSSGYASTVRYAPLKANGGVGSWSTTTALPGALGYTSAVTSNGYIYVVGGTNGTANQAVVYYGKQNSDGTVTAWQTATLPAATNAASAVVANGFLYVLGGNVSGASTVNTYYTHINSDGSLNTFVSGTSLPVALANGSSFTSNGNIYYLGGINGSGTLVATSYYATLNSDGSFGSWTATTSMPSTAANFGAVLLNGYVYVIKSSSTVSYAPMNSNGTIGAWASDSNALPVSNTGMSVVTNNGYVYVMGGYNGSAGTTAVYYTSGARTMVAGALDLVGLTATGNLSGDGSQENGSLGGTLTAGNTTIVGTLQVQAQANFAQNVAINGNNLTIGNDNDDPNTGSTSITVQSRGYSGINIYGDSENTTGEPGGAYIVYSTDGVLGTEAVMGLVQGTDIDPSGTAYTGAVANNLLVGNRSNFGLQLGTNSNVRMTVMNSGNVCIGVATCTKKLGVSGTIGASGTITASTTPDLAETIAAADDVEAADVVMADPNNTERVVKSDRAYNTATVGVISDGTSSFMINSYGGTSGELTGKPLVLAGRVPVKVSGANGAIKPGDYLTSADIPGYAMKATHAGPSIGKALGYFNGDKGTVLVLVNLNYYNPSTDIQGTSEFQNINVAGNVVIDGDLTVKGATNVGTITIEGHIVTKGNAPQIQLLSASGQNASATVTGNDISGVVSVTTGSQSVAADDILKILFSKAYSSSPRVVLTPVGKDSAQAGGYVDQTQSDSFMIGITNVTANGKTYVFNYQVMQ